jgi:hypothetical protein
VQRAEDLAQEVGADREPIDRAVLEAADRPVLGGRPRSPRRTRRALCRRAPACRSSCGRSGTAGPGTSAPSRAARRCGSECPGGWPCRRALPARPSAGSRRSCTSCLPD